MTFSDSSCDSCDLGIDEINFSIEPCLSFRQGKRYQSNWLINVIGCNSVVFKTTLTWYSFTEVIVKENSVLCPKDWMQFSSNCYKFHTNATTWGSAVPLCEDEKGATLVIFNNEKEDKYVTTMMESQTSMPFWIGLKDLDKDSNYEWLDKSNSTYRNWFNKGRENCVVAASGGWSTANCSSPHSSVCEYKQGIGNRFLGIEVCKFNVNCPFQIFMTLLWRIVSFKFNLFIFLSKNYRATGLTSCRSDFVPV